jgi:putative addiction module component (TIGR02574 family)
MSKIDEAVTVLKALPADRQDAVMEMIFDLAAHASSLRLTDAQVAEMERRANAPPADLMTLEEFCSRVSKLGSCGL